MNKFVKLIFFLMALIIIFVSFFTFKRRNNKKLYKITNKDKVSVIILNYKRPHNLKKLIPELLTYPLIDDIIVSNGLKGKEFELFNKRVKIINDFKIDKLYGAAIRFLKIKHVKNDIVLFIDDDIIPSEDLVNKLYFNVKNNYNRNTIYGPFARICCSKGISPLYVQIYNFIKDIFNIEYDSWSYNSILTPILMCKASIIHDYLQSDEGWIKYKEWFKKYKGNCEDLSLNKFIESYYNEMPERVNGKFRSLDWFNGYSSTKLLEFRKIRSDFCRKYSIK